jgi:predicted ATPase
MVPRSLAAEKGIGMNTADSAYQPVMGFGISGYRTLRDIEVLSPGPVTIICGPNNVGKSSFLSALPLYADLVAALHRKRLRQAASEISGSDMTAKIALDFGSVAFKSALAEKTSEKAFAALEEALSDGLREPIWIDFDYRREGWTPDLDRSLRVLNSVVQAWDSDTSRRNLGRALARAFGTTYLDQEWLRVVAESCLPRPSVRFVPDVRRTAERPLDDADLWDLARANVRRTGRQDRVEAWADQLEQVLRDVFGDDVRYEVRPVEGSGDFRLLIDGEEDRELGTVGAGVREVVAIAHAALRAEGSAVLAIEEPENCLHPVAVKRLIESLPRRANVQLFVSTHSSAVVNANPDAVVHLTRSGTTTVSRQVSSAPDRYEAVRSLGYSPADLVLTPCALWVEGPSDRRYLRSWLEAEGLVEGVDYQIMFFAGALAAHISVSADTLPREALVAIRNLARYCAILVDSDKDRRGARRKPHVTRFIEELDGDSHAELLVTPGREIENYLPLRLVNEIRAEKKLPPIAEADYPYARVVDAALAKKMSKIQFAEEAIERLRGEVPEIAMKDVRRLARFIRAATSEKH